MENEPSTSDIVELLKAKRNVASSSENGTEKVVKKKKFHPQKYRDAWEHHEEFFPWLSRCPEDHEVAFCKACDCTIQPRFATIQKHSRALKHAKKVKLFSDIAKNRSISSDCEAEEINHRPSFSQVEKNVVSRDVAVRRDIYRDTPIKRTQPDIYFGNYNFKKPSTTPPLSPKVDDYSVFGEYVALELRNLSSETLKRKLKRLILKSVLEVVEEEELSLEKSSSESLENAPAPQMYATYILTEQGDAVLAKPTKGVLAFQKDDGSLYQAETS